MNPPKYYLKNTFDHLYNRGTNKGRVFYDDKDYAYFIKRLKRYKEKYFISVLLYCLMPNHFHVLVKQTTDHPTEL